MAPSSISGDIIKYKNTRRSATAREIAEYGNSLLPIKGYNYWIDVGDLNKKKGKEARILSEELQVYPYSMTLSGGKNRSFLIFAPRNDSCCCGYFYAEFPVTRITETSITFISNGNKYAVNRPKDLAISEVYELVDIKDPSKTLRKWQIPYETYPEGISADGTKLYIEGPVDEILLEIGSNGEFRFVEKGEVKSGEGEQGSLPANPGNAYEDCLKFTAGGHTYHIKYSGPCT